MHPLSGALGCLHGEYNGEKTHLVAKLQQILIGLLGTQPSSVFWAAYSPDWLMFVEILYFSRGAKTTTYSHQRWQHHCFKGALCNIMSLLDVFVLRCT